jgi:hypothetical protein
MCPEVTLVVSLEVMCPEVTLEVTLSVCPEKLVEAWAMTESKGRLVAR